MSVSTLDLFMIPPILLIHLILLMPPISLLNIIPLFPSIPAIPLFAPPGAAANDKWEFIPYRSDGRVHIFGEWAARTKSQRYVVIGPDWACVAMTYIVLVVPSSFVSIYLLDNLTEKIVYFALFGLCIFGLTTVFIADPGLVRKYHHARSRHWTYW